MIASFVIELPALWGVAAPDPPESRLNMKPIAIVPRPGREIGVELRDAIVCLRDARIYASEAVTGQACALIWVEDEETANSVETLRIAGFQVTALTETDVPY
jgi:hypothetical protein